ncbi:MAG: uncharacterized protein QG580_447 [Patescibacteria group bacterium]|jgi:uncharacterized protein YggU (UPF0235/DUF167 family)|nr:uncharacterized protein [Patescibacteria group bacterium]
MYIRVRVVPAQKRELVKETGEKRLEIRVKEKAEQNLANKRVTEILAEKYGVSLGKIRLVNGHHHPVKLFSVEI